MERALTPEEKRELDRVLFEPPPTPVVDKAERRKRVAKLGGEIALVN